MAEQLVKVRKVGGPRVVDTPGPGRGRLQRGDEVELPKELAEVLVAGGEFELVKPATKKEPAPVPVEKES